MIFIVFEDKQEIGIDATTSLGIQMSSETTDNEVEEGSDITDNVVRSPKVYSLEGFMSNVPLTATGNYAFNADGFHQVAFDKLEKAWENAERIEIDAGHRGYFNNLVITSFSSTQTPETGSGVPISLTFKQLRFVEPQLSFNSLSSVESVSLGADLSLSVVNAEAEQTAQLFADAGTTGVVSTFPQTTRQAGRMAGIVPGETNQYRP